MWPLKKSASKVSSRKQIAIKHVRDSILVLPNYEYRLVIETSSVNFELKSEAEQDLLIDNFQSFLNALPSSLQILIRIRELDLDTYLAGIAQIKNQEPNQEYRNLVDSYTSFIRKLVSGNKILSRRFYIVIPYTPQENKKDFELARQQILLTRDLVIKSLEKLGMKARQLDTFETLGLFYAFYNKSQLKTQELKGETIKSLLKHTYA